MIASTPVPTITVVREASMSVNPPVRRRDLKAMFLLDAMIFRLPSGTGHFTMADILKIGKMIAIAMKPTILPIATIMIGSIIEVTDLMASFNCFP